MREYMSSWKSIEAGLLELVQNEENLDGVAELLARVLPIFLQGEHSLKYFQFWEEHGFHVTPVHFYQPIPDCRTLPDGLWEKPGEMPGVDMNEAAQLQLLREIFPQYRDEYNEIPSGPTTQPHEFHLVNPAFDGTDALVLYCMVRQFKPRLILEVGSGHSSRLSARAALKNGNTELVCIEPYPDPILEAGFPGLTTLVRKSAQDAGMELFQRLGPSDILFIDSSHVVKCGGDVNFLFLEVLPRLKPGVIVHVHDIFLPNEFPKEWILKLHLFWTEQYLLQAFLIHNSEFEVLFANAFMGLRHNEEMQAAFPKSPWWGGGSFWIRRRVKVEKSREK
jgi:hypothetical protein